MAQVEWTSRALDDLRQIHDFIGRDSPWAASGLIDRIFSATERPELFPRSGRSVPEFPGLSYREIVVASYRVLYRIEGEKIVVMAVVHGRRDLQAPP